MVAPSERRHDRFLREDQAGTQEPAHVALLKSEERFRLLVEAVHDYALIMLDAQGRILCWNKGAERLTGYEAADMLSRHVSVLYRQDDQRAGQVEHLLQTAARQGAWEGTLWQTRKDQDAFLAHIMMRAILDDNGHVIAFSHVTHDITAQKRQEDLLRDQAQQFRVITEALPGIVFLASPQGGCDYLNSTFYAYTGMAPGSGEGTAWQTAVHPHDHDAFRQAWTTARNTGEGFEQMVRLRRADQTFRWFLVRVCPIRDGGGRLTRWIGACTDVHDLRITEEALRLAQTETHAGVWSWDLTNDRMSWSPEYYDLCGLDSSIVPSYENWLASIAEEDRARADSCVRRHSMRGQTSACNLRFTIRREADGASWPSGR